MAIDYGIQVPQIQPVQPTNMLQQIMLFNQLNEARQTTQARNAMRAVFAQPDFDPTTPEGMRALFQAGGINAGPAISAAATARRELRQGEEAEKKGGLADIERRLKLASHYIDQLPAVTSAPDPNAAWAAWRTQFGKEVGDNSKFPEQYPGPEQARHIMMTAQQFIESRKTQRFEVGGVPVESVPGSGVAQEMIIRPPQPGGPAPAPGGLQADVTGVPSYPVNPQRMAQMRQAGQTYAPELMTDAAPTPPMPPARPPEVANAMSPYGALPSANALATAPGGRPASEVIAAKEAADRLRKVGQTRLETIAREEAKSGVEREEKTKDKTIGKTQFDNTFSRMVDQYKKLAKRGYIITNDSRFVDNLRTGAAAASPSVAGIVAPQTAPMSTLQNLRQQMVASLIAANPGMSSKSIDSNAELKAYLDSLSTPGQPVEAIVDTMNALSEKYGSGKQITVEDIVGKNTARAPAGRGRAPTAPAVPAGVDPAVWGIMTPEERALWLK